MPLNPRPLSSGNPPYLLNFYVQDNSYIDIWIDIIYIIDSKY